MQPTDKNFSLRIGRLCKAALWLSLCGGFIGIRPCAAADPEKVVRAEAHDVTAALVLNLAKYVNGPSDWFVPEDPHYHIGVAGSPELLHAFKALEGKLVGGRPVKINPFSEKHDCERYQLIYFGGGREEKLGLRQKPSDRPSVLTVCGSNFHASHDCILAFSVEDGHMAITIYRDRADAAGLKISTQLLNLAHVIENGYP